MPAHHLSVAVVTLCCSLADGAWQSTWAASLLGKSPDAQICADYRDDSNQAKYTFAKQESVGIKGAKYGDKSGVAPYVVYGCKGLTTDYADEKGCKHIAKDLGFKYEGKLPDPGTGQPPDEATDVCVTPTADEKLQKRRVYAAVSTDKSVYSQKDKYSLICTKATLKIGTRIKGLNDLFPKVMRTGDIGTVKILEKDEFRVDFGRPNSGGKNMAAPLKPSSHWFKEFKIVGTEPPVDSGIVQQVEKDNYVPGTGENRKDTVDTAKDVSSLLEASNEDSLSSLLQARAAYGAEEEMEEEEDREIDEMIDRGSSWRRSLAGKKKHRKAEQWKELKVLLRDAWAVAAKKTAMTNTTKVMCVHDDAAKCRKAEEAKQDVARISLEGFLESVNPKSPGWSAEHKNKESYGMFLCKTLPVMKEMGSDDITGFIALRKKFAKQVFDLGLAMMNAHANQLAEKGTRGTANQPRSWQGLDRHAFAYCWLVVYGQQHVDCGLFYCSMVPKNDIFFGPPQPENPDNQGVMAKVRSKLWQYRLFAGYAQPAEKDVNSMLKKKHSIEHEVRIERNDFVKFWYALKGEKISKDSVKEAEDYHEFLVKSFDAAQNSGWRGANGKGKVWHHKGGAYFHGVGFQYMSLLAAEYPCERRHNIGKTKVKYLDQLELLKDIKEGDPDFPLVEG